MPLNQWADAVAEFVVKVGILPAIIFAMGYYIWKLEGAKSKAQDEWLKSLIVNTAALASLTEYVRGRKDAQ